MATAKVDPLDPLLIDGGDDPATIDDKMKDLARQVAELIGVEHYLGVQGARGVGYNEPEAGEHKLVTLHEQASPSEVAANKGIVFGKLAGGITELFYINENDAEVQITSGGKIPFASLAALGNNSVDTLQIVDDAVTSDKINDGSVLTGNIGPAAVTLAKMAADSVDSNQYVDGSIDKIHMSANSVDSAQYVDGSIDKIHMSDDSVDSAEIVNGAIDLAHMSASSVDTNQYVDDSITAEKLTYGGRTAGFDPTGVGGMGTTDEMTLPNGFKMAWGVKTCLANSETIVTPPSFADIFDVQLTIIEDSNGDRWAPKLGNINNTTFTIWNQAGASTVNVRWRVIGR